MVVIVISEKETKFKDETFNKIWYELVDIVQQNGIPIYFLKDSRIINDGINQIVDKLYDFVSEIKHNKESIKMYQEGKKMKKLVSEQDKNSEKNEGKKTI